MYSVPASSHAVLLAEVAALRSENAQLRTELAESRYSSDFACPKFPLLKEHWASLEYSQYAFVYWDLDGLNECNFRYGDEGVHERVRAAYGLLQSHMRRTDTIYLYRGGDEFCTALLVATAEQAAYRCLGLLQANGLSATFAVVQATPDLGDCVRRASALIRQGRGGARGEGRRGLVQVEAGLRERLATLGDYHG